MPILDNIATAAPVRPRAAASRRTTAGEALPAMGDLVEAIYASVLQPQRLHHALLLLRELFEADNATLVVRPSTPQDPGFTLCVPPNPAAEVAYCTHWFRHDPFVTLPDLQPVLISDVMSNEEWEGCAFYQRYLRSVLPLDNRDLGTGHMLGVNISTPSGTVSRLRITRMSSRPAFAQEHKGMLRSLVPHLRQALALTAHVQRERREREHYEETLDSFGIGILVLDEEARLLRANASGLQLVEAGDGIRLAHRRPETCSPQETDKLHELMRRTLAEPGACVAMRVGRPSGLRGLNVLVRSIPLLQESEGRARPAWSLCIRDPEASTNSAKGILRQVFGFTPAEASLAQLLMDGASLAEAAERLDIRHNTARAHLRAVFSKAGVHRQADLIRVLFNAAVSGVDQAPADAPAGKRAEPSSRPEAPQLSSAASAALLS